MTGRAGQRVLGRPLHVVLMAILTAVTVTCGESYLSEDRSLPVPVPAAGPPAGEAPLRTAPVPDTAGREAVEHPRGEPVRVVIPTIGVDARLVDLGLEPNRDMEVPPFGLAGWYTEGPRPGHPGPATITAHVSSRAGPDVFARLRELRPGEEVRVLFDSGDDVTFVVEGREQVPKDRLPGGRIWPVSHDRTLALITCGGVFDRARGSHRDNVIVYTRYPADF